MKKICHTKKITPTVTNKIYYFTEIGVSKLKLIIIYVANSKIQTSVFFFHQTDIKGDADSG